MKSLKNLFTTKNTDSAPPITIEDSIEDREQIRITYYQSGFAASIKASGTPIVLKTCFQNLYTSFLDQCRKQKSEQERLKQPFKEDQERNRTDLKKWETAIGVYEFKEQELSDSIKEIKHDIIDVRVRPEQHGISDGKGAKARFYIGLFLILPITLYLLVFYISASYSAFFKMFSDDSLTAAIFDADALTNSFNASWLEGILVITIPFVFMGLGFVIHMMQKEKGNKKIFKISGLYLLTFLFDALLAYQIEKKIYEFNKTLDSLPYNLQIAIGEAEFWMIIFAGFVVYVIWGLVFDFVMKEYENLDEINVFIRGKQDKMADLLIEKSENKDKVIEFRQKVVVTNGIISELQTKIDGFVFPVKEYLLYHNQYKEGWYQAIGTEIALPHTEKRELLESCDLLSDKHLHDLNLVTTDIQLLDHSQN
jgi:hypothetical protein